MVALSQYYSPGNPAFDRERIAEDCRRNLYKFVGHAWPHVDPSTYIYNWHVGAISEHLQAVTDKQIQKLIINVPPGCAKSTIVSVMWPAWEWIANPGEQSLFGSYDEDLALRDSVKCRNVFESPWYKETFRPQWKLSKDQKAKGFYVNTAFGNRYTFGMLTGQTGWRGNKVVLDDPNNVKHRYDSRIKKETYDVFNNVLSSRVNDLMTSSFIIIQQRMANDDMTGLLMKENSDNKVDIARVNDLMPFEWVQLKIPMVGTSRPCKTFIGWGDHRKEGELLFPAKFPQVAVDYMRHKKLGEDGYASQFQQDPVPEGGSRFKEEYFLYWKDLGRGAIQLLRRGGVTEIINLNTCWTFVSVDLAASEKKSADYTVFSTWAVSPKYDLILLNSRRGQWGEPKIIANAVEIYGETRYNNQRHSCFVVEDNGLGLPICQAMQARGIPVLPVNVNRVDKIVRSTTAIVRLESGQIFWPDPNLPWFCDPDEGWKIEHMMFPAFDHDDQVDTTSLAAEAVFQAGMFGAGDVSTLTREARTAVEIMEQHAKSPTFASTAKKMFGRR